MQVWPGAVEILDCITGCLSRQRFRPDMVLTGIVVALFGKLHPLGIIPSSILFGGLLVGGDKMQRAMQVPRVLTVCDCGLIILFVVQH